MSSRDDALDRVMELLSAHRDEVGDRYTALNTAYADLNRIRAALAASDEPDAREPDHTVDLNTVLEDVKETVAGWKFAMSQLAGTPVDWPESSPRKGQRAAKRALVNLCVYMGVEVPKWVSDRDGLITQSTPGANTSAPDSPAPEDVGERVTLVRFQETAEAHAGRWIELDASSGEYVINGVHEVRDAILLPQSDGGEADG